MKRKLLLFTLLITSVLISFSQTINNGAIHRSHSPSQEEMEWAINQGRIAPFKALMPPPTGQIRPIAEFEPAEAVLVSATGTNTFGNDILQFGVPMSLIKEMAEDIKVITIVSSESQKNTVINNHYTPAGVNLANCEFLIARANTYWTRDYGPWFMAIDNNTVGMFDFTYNRPRYQDNAVNSILAPYLSSAAGGGIQIDRYVSNLVLTGGNYMTDGIKQGFSTTLVLSENSGFTQQQIRTQYQEYLGIDSYHFIADPITPYDNIQHIDCWSKLLSPNKVLVARVPSGTPNYQKFEDAANYFAGLTSSWGMPMEVIRVNVSAVTSSVTTPYTNSLILNKKVFVPINSTTNANDLAALQVYENAMPGYEIIGINYGSWLNTDALHCRTHEIADRCMLYVKHQPYFAEIENIGSLTFSTELYSYCNNTIYSDSVIVYLRIDGGEYEPYNMEFLQDNTWEVQIDGLPGGLIEYYVFAADESGRRECHPYIGAPDPHKFILTETPPPPPVPVLSLNKTSSSVYSVVLTIVEDYITVYNLGNADLTIAVTDIDFNEMLTIDPQSGTISENDSLTITLSYNFNSLTKGDIEFVGDFKLTSNDPLNPETEITLLATLGVGISETNIPEINIYPNPTTGELRISPAGGGQRGGNNYDLRIKSVEVFDVYGRLLQSKIVNLQSEIAINISHLHAGIYFVRITTDSGHLVVRKVSKI